jgi:hypothetical protein
MLHSAILTVLLLTLPTTPSPAPPPRDPSLPPSADRRRPPSPDSAATRYHSHASSKRFSCWARAQAVSGLPPGRYAAARPNADPRPTR